MALLVPEHITWIVNIINLNLGILATLLNTILTYIVFTRDDGTLSRAMIGNVAVVDFMCGIAIATMCALRIHVGVPLVYSEFYFCNGIGMLCIFFTCFSSYLIGLGVERVFRVRRYQGMSWTCAYAISTFVFVALVITCFGAMAKKGFGPDPTLVYCLPYGTTWSKVMFSIAKITLVVPFPVQIASYGYIFWHCYKNIPNFPLWAKSCRMILFISVYALCYIPSLFFIFFHTFLKTEQCPIFVMLASPIGIAALPAANPFLVLLLNQQMGFNLSKFFRGSKETMQTLASSDTIDEPNN